MKIYYHDAIRKSKEREEGVQATFCSTLVELVATADCVVLLVPFAGRTIVTADLLSKFKKGSRFINVARGPLIDEEALADALDSGHISAAGLDVHADEPNINKRLGQMRNVSLTCHNGGGAVETRAEFERLVMENVDRGLTGREPLTPVNLHLMKHLN